MKGSYVGEDTDESDFPNESLSKDGGTKLRRLKGAVGRKRLYSDSGSSPNQSVEGFWKIPNSPEIHASYSCTEESELSIDSAKEDIKVCFQDAKILKADEKPTALYQINEDEVDQLEMPESQPDSTAQLTVQQLRQQREILTKIRPVRTIEERRHSLMLKLWNLNWRSAKLTLVGVIVLWIEKSVGSKERRKAVLDYSIPMKILFINPNSTEHMTDACVAMISKNLPADVEVEGFTGPRTGPSAIESFSDAVLCCSVNLPLILQRQAEYDAFLVGCFSHHPLTQVLREELSQPVIGIMEAALNAAKCLGSKIGIITTGDRAVYMQDDAVRHYGLEGSYAGSESCRLGVLELESKSVAEVEDIMCGAAMRLVAEKGADVLTLGCAGMTNIRPKVEARIGPDVPVIDGVEHGIHQLISLVRLGARTSKSGLYKSAAASRQARGQTYL
ncbi:Uncharacterized protein C1F7.10 [Taphrina deformans PYCC 5710]|uniref:Uncharacterized protein C1F7.10 n=1 Tax=Taphrina deformans (strain PYCC 5710 / ATCC 11124 / CBS 356.35 / IMI 108563 / JCM 9778 / NBRC 8474) TaxID=1097556 RepID=R4X8N2_TAPDE|nr:Uncharacterized protein C1F7.10 [Taphrina deformans PYCC 5710]|eukprot:CCG81735.1 Uncharacterized protein C1F7.10 [Taphrina deformans PYCC 5710]